MIRSVLAILAGYLVFGASATILYRATGQESSPGTWFAVFSVLYGIGFAVLGGYLAAEIARQKPLLHSGIVAGVIVVIGLFLLISQSSKGPVWSEALVLACMAPAALFGGWLRR